MSLVYSETFPADYSRLEQTPFTRSRLRQLSCVVVGAGALGNEVARVLGLLGSLRVTVVDPDVVEASNLPRSIFFCGRETAGQNKAAALVAAAGRMFPETQWTAIGTEIADVGFQKLADANLLFSCVDSDLARLEMAYISARLRVPMVDGGLGRQNYSHGRVTYFPATANQACYGCMLSPTKRRELLELWQSTLRPCAPESDAGDSELVSTPTMAGIIGCIQVEFGLRSFYEGGRTCVCPQFGTPDSSCSPDGRLRSSSECGLSLFIALRKRCAAFPMRTRLSKTCWTVPSQTCWCWIGRFA